jgi:hypothetical protein
MAGRILSEDASSISVAINPAEPDSQNRVPRSDIATLTLISPMPAGLINSLSRDEILDLVAWLEATH